MEAQLTCFPIRWNGWGLSVSISTKTHLTRKLTRRSGLTQRRYLEKPLQPFAFGADIIVHSTSKYMDGHAVQIGGAIVDSGNLNQNDYRRKYPSETARRLRRKYDRCTDTPEISVCAGSGAFFGLFKSAVIQERCNEHYKARACIVYQSPCRWCQ